MTLDKLKINEKGRVKAINCNRQLKNRLHSFGVVKGVNLKIETLTLAKNTMEIKVGSTNIAIRMSEAKDIEVEYA